jgi:hypothetical protein
LADRRSVKRRTFAIAGALVALVIAVVVSQFAADAPDGLERVAADTGIIEAATDHALDSGIFAEYATSGVDNETVSLAIAGAAGTVLTLAVGFGIFIAIRDRERDVPRERTPA